MKIVFYNLKSRILINIGLLLFFASCRIVNFYTDEPFKISKEVHAGFFPDYLSESSGLEILNDSLISFNDSGGKTSLYIFSPLTPERPREIPIHGVKNYDWEAIARDKHNLYIADFGNNYGSRDTLEIYKYRINSPGNNDSKPEVISFHYSGKGPEFFNVQKNHFDCEAITLVEDSLWIFTKNWSDQSSSIYKVPVEPGHYEIVGDTILKPGMLVTGADFYPEKNMLFLIGYRNYFPRIRAYSLVQGDIKELFMIHYFNRFGLQTEGIVVANGELIYFSYEKSIKKQGLFQFSVIEKTEKNR
jgi:hypothetical protein